LPKYFSSAAFAESLGLKGILSASIGEESSFNRRRLWVYCFLK